MLNQSQAKKIDKNPLSSNVPIINDLFVKNQRNEVVADSNESSMANEVTSTGARGTHGSR